MHAHTARARCLTHGKLPTLLLTEGIVNLLIVMPNVHAERPAFWREKASGMYGGLSYSTAQGAAEFIYLIIQVR